MYLRKLNFPSQNKERDIMKIYLLDLDSLEYSIHSVKQFIELFNVEESLCSDTRVFTNLKKLKKFLKDYT